MLRQRRPHVLEIVPIIIDISPSSTASTTAPPSAYLEPSHAPIKTTAILERLLSDLRAAIKARAFEEDWSAEHEAVRIYHRKHAATFHDVELLVWKRLIRPLLDKEVLGENRRNFSVILKNFPNSELQTLGLDGVHRVDDLVECPCVRVWGGYRGFVRHCRVSIGLGMFDQQDRVEMEGERSLARELLNLVEQGGTQHVLSRRRVMRLA